MKLPNKLVTMRNGVIIGIKIQSINDIITNSSSEIVCTIKGEDLKVIYDLLKTLLPNTDSELGPIVLLWKEGEYYKDSPAFIQVDLPYGFDCAKFFREGIKAILDQTFGKDFYTMEYDY